MRAKDFVPASKPRNFVVKNQKTAGAGVHKDKKRAAKQGDVKHKKQDVEEGWDDIKKFGKKAAVAGAIGLGALGGAQAQDAPSGEDFLPDIVAHVTFKIDGKTISKDINLGTAYKSPGQAGDALAKFLKSKGIKYYDYSLERVKPNEPLVTPDEMRASNQEYDRQQNTGNLDPSPLTDKGDSKSGRMEPDKGYTSPSRGAQAKDYMSKEDMDAVLKFDALAERNNLQFRQAVMKGTGQVSDFETKLVERASGLNRDTSIESNRFFATVAAENFRMFDKLGTEWQSYQKRNPGTTFDKFEQSPEFKSALKERETRLTAYFPELSTSETAFGSSKPKSNASSKEIEGWKQRYGKPQQ
jgi:hypothetical protein